MAKTQENIILSGTVIEMLPNALFRIKLESEAVILGHLSGKMRMHNISIRLGDKVDMEISPYDLSKGRITYRHKLENPNKKN